jgi:beta-galactosidase
MHKENKMNFQRYIKIALLCLGFITIFTYGQKTIPHDEERIKDVTLFELEVLQECHPVAATPRTQQKKVSIPERINIDFNWQFHLGKLENSESTVLNNKNSINLDLPHDWSIEGVPDEENPSGKNGGYYPGGIGWYQKEIQWNNSWKNKQISITFDGVYMNSDVWVNGHHLGHKPNGYIGFTYNITPYLNSEKNIITVKVDNSKQPSSRWYTGCGINRHVWLNVKNKVHIPISGTYVYVSKIDSSYARMHVETEIKNTSDENQNIIIETKIFKQDQSLVDVVSNEIHLKGNSLITAKQNLDLANPPLWSPKNPYLYEIETTIKKGGKALDIIKTKTGIRSLKFDGQTGFWLNNKKTKIKGVCMHHEAGALGSAVPEDVWIRRIQLLKDMGCNAIRTSHNPFRPEFYTLCDSMGMLVMNEALDGWDTPKATFDYGLYFKEWWETDITDFIKRDRNHPSIFMWSIGNEVRGRTDSIETLSS